MREITVRREKKTKYPKNGRDRKVDVVGIEQYDIYFMMWQRGNDVRICHSDRTKGARGCSLIYIYTTLDPLGTSSMVQFFARSILHQSIPKLQDVAEASSRP